MRNCYLKQTEGVKKISFYKNGLFFRKPAGQGTNMAATPINAIVRLSGTAAGQAQDKPDNGSRRSMAVYVAFTIVNGYFEAYVCGNL